MFQTRHLALRLSSRVMRAATCKNIGAQSHSLSALPGVKANAHHATNPFAAPSSNLLPSRLMSSSSSKFEVINIQDEEDFKKRVIGADKPVVVDFHATWCGPCKLLGPRLESIISEESGKVIMAKVDIDDNSDLAMDYGVRSVPTVMAMKDGKVVNQFIGLVDDDQIRGFIDKLTV